MNDACLPHEYSKTGNRTSKEKAEKSDGSLSRHLLCYGKQKGRLCGWCKDLVKMFSVLYHHRHIHQSHHPHLHHHSTFIPSLPSAPLYCSRTLTSPLSIKLNCDYLDHQALLRKRTAFRYRGVESR